MHEHPLYRMWKERYETELAREQEHAARRAVRDQELADWYQAWHKYKARASAPYKPLPKPRWWDLPGWARWLLSLHAPGRPN